MGLLRPNFFVSAKWLAMISQLVFLLLITPGHTRGAMRVDGKAVGTSEVKEEACGKCCSRETENKKEKEPTQADQRACAICHVTAQLDTAVVTRVEAPRPELIGRAELLGMEQGVREAAAGVYDGRAPPV